MNGRTQALIDRITTFLRDDKWERGVMLEMKEAQYYSFTNDINTHYAMTFWNWIYDNDC